MKKALSVIILTFFIFSLTSCTVIDAGFNTIKEFLSSPVSEKTETEEREKEIDNSITIGIVELDTYNPLYTKSKTMKNMLNFIFEPVFSINSDMTTEGVFAHSYQTSPDGKSLIINLKEGIKWHDGTPFTANDVVYTFEKLKSTITNYSYLVKDINYVKANGSYSLSVAFYRSVPNPIALFSFPIIKNGSCESSSFKPIGTGPFVLYGEKLISFAEYHGEKSKLDYINVMSVPDDEKFLSLFSASVIDIADSLMIDMTSYMPKNNASVYDYVSNKMIFAGFNANSPVFKFAEARRSVSKLFDRRHISTHIYFSRAMEALSPVNPQSRLYYDNGLSPRSDVSGSALELTEAGWKKDKRGVFCYSDNKSLTYFTVRILVNSENSERTKIAEDISKRMTESGMRNTLIKCNANEFSNRVRNGNYDMFIGEIELLPNNDLTELLATGNNTLNFSDEKTDIILSQLGTLSTENDIKNVWKSLSERIYETCPVAPICFIKESLLTSAKLKNGVEPSVESMVRQSENWSVYK